MEGYVIVKQLANDCSLASASDLISSFLSLVGDLYKLVSDFLKLKMYNSSLHIRILNLAVFVC